MKSELLTKKWWHWAIFAVLFCIVAPLDGGEYYYQQAADQLIFRHTVSHSFMADSPQFELEIYGDGTTRIYVHPVNKIDGLHQRGQFEAKLASERIREIFDILEKEGVLSFRAETVRAKKAAEPKQGPATDPLVVQFEIHLEEYIGVAGATGPIEKHIQWTGPMADADRYPEIKSLQGLARATKELTLWLCDLARELERAGAAQ